MFTLPSFASYSPVGVSSSIQSTYLDYIIQCTAFPFGKCPDGTFGHDHGRRLSCLKEKCPHGNASIKFQ
jgi:hypothetical protein